MGQVVQILEKEDRRELVEFLMAKGQALLPMVALIEQAQMAVWRCWPRLIGGWG